MLENTKVDIDVIAIFRELILLEIIHIQVLLLPVRLKRG